MGSSQADARSAQVHGARRTARAASHDHGDDVSTSILLGLGPPPQSVSVHAPSRSADWLSFSSFPRGTCLLSVSRPYLALDGIYRPIWAAFPNNPTHRQRLVMRQGLGHDGAFTLSSAPFQGTWARSATEDASPDYNSNVEDARFSSWALLGSLTVTRGILGRDACAVDNALGSVSLIRPMTYAQRELEVYLTTERHDVHRRRQLVFRLTAGRLAHGRPVSAHGQVPSSLSRRGVWVGQRCVTPRFLGAVRTGVRCYAEGARAGAIDPITEGDHQARTPMLPPDDKTGSQVVLLGRFSGLLATLQAANCPRRRDSNTSPDHSIGRSDGRQIAPPTKNGHAPPPIESRKSSQSVYPYYVWTCNSAGGTTRPIKAKSASPTEGTSPPVHTGRRTGRPNPRSNYELFNCNKLNIRYWSWNYRSCWHQTCPPMDPH
ncbi:hypothetical protein EZV62_015353 [Acer yangbiense]|uniref:Protein TAR1 n=1 Tax=Acer yangbiense TaxID=1000413 RepID=A0A5C7HKX4_9ROSI|nr:hypothetical protein EZV62_015353 [Acer yangbiense]